MVVKGRALETRSLQVTRRLGVMPRQLEAEYQMTGLSSGECEAKLNNVALSWASLWGSAYGGHTTSGQGAWQAGE